MFFKKYFHISLKKTVKKLMHEFANRFPNNRARTFLAVKYSFDYGNYRINLTSFHVDLISQTRFQKF